MFMKKAFGVLAAALSITALVACGNGVKGDDQDFDQSGTGDSPTLVLSVVGSKFASWNPADSALEGSGCLFTKIDSSHYQFTSTIAVGDEFKIVGDGTWGNQYGVEDLDFENSTAGFVIGTAADYTEGKTNRSNFKPQLTGDMTIDFYPYFFLDSKLANPIVITVK